MNVNIIEKANIIVNSSDVAYIGVIDEHGSPSVSTVSRIKTDGIYESFFSGGIDNNKAKRIQNNSKVSVCYRKDADNVTLVGEAVVLTDKEIRHALWQDWFINHFPKGKDDPTYCIIKFTTKRISLWVEGESLELSMKELNTVTSRCGLLCTGCCFKISHGCGGCVETNGNPFHGECPIAKCCQDKGYTHCGECDNLPTCDGDGCKDLYAYSYLDEEHGDKPCGARINMLKHWAKL